MTHPMHHIKWLFASIGSFIMYVFSMLNINATISTIASVIAIVSGAATAAYFITKTLLLWKGKKDE